MAFNPSPIVSRAVKARRIGGAEVDSSLRQGALSPQAEVCLHPQLRVTPCLAAESVAFAPACRSPGHPGDRPTKGDSRLRVDCSGHGELPGTWFRPEAGM